jgi:hypothetical protein
MSSVAWNYGINDFLIRKCHGMEVVVAKYEALTRYCFEGTEEYRYKLW